MATCREDPLHLFDFCLWPSKKKKKKKKKKKYISAYSHQKQYETMFVFKSS